jgi:hypothetical protein
VLQEPRVQPEHAIAPRKHDLDTDDTRASSDQRATKPLERGNVLLEKYFAESVVTIESQPAMAHAEDQALEAVAWAGSRLDHFTMKGASRPAPSWSAKHMCSRLNFYGRVEVGPRGTNAK